MSAHYEFDNKENESVQQVFTKIWTDIYGCLPCKGQPQPSPMLTQRSSPPAGVGIVFEVLPNDTMRVHQVLANSEAEEQGIEVGDILLEVDKVKARAPPCQMAW